jgi:hypothetical protein
MSEERVPLDLRVLADVDSPEVVHEALRRFRRRMLTRYVWVALAIVFAAVALLVGGRPSDLREEMEKAHTRSFPTLVWRIGGRSVALEEVADLGDDMGLHFVVLPDPGKWSSMIWVRGETESMGWGSYDTYVKLPKIVGDTIEVTVGAGGCAPCPQRSTITVDFRELKVPRSVWRNEG